MTIAAPAGLAGAIRPDGVFEGYASLFGVPDGAGDVVMPGAFRDSLARRGAAAVRMLFQHDPGQPIGTWSELSEDSRGLFVRGQLTHSVQRADELRRLLAEGAIDGLSIGFRTVRGRIDPKTRVRRLHQVDLWEISLVTFPLLAGARVRAVKGDRHDPDERLFRRHPRFSFTGARREGGERMAANRRVG
jgi:HK97 family phage prohead protease